MSSPPPNRAEIRLQIAILVSFGLVLWLIQILNLGVFHNSLTRYGIWPRHWVGLLGIVLAPWLHGSFQHLMANTMPLLVFSWWVMGRGIHTWTRVTLIATIVSGLGTWLCGSPTSIHIGASGIIFGYVGFLMMAGHLKGNVRTTRIAVVLLVLYTSLHSPAFSSLLTIPSGISWESHSFGFLGGLLAAVWPQNPKSKI